MMKNDSSGATDLPTALPASSDSSGASAGAVIRPILLVDDDQNLLKLVQRMMTGTSYQLTTATSAEAALLMMQQRSFDIIISDVTLPRMDGIELLEKVKADDPDRPFILITGFVSVEKAVDAMKKGAFDFLTKPFDKDKLLLAVEKAARQAELYRELRSLRTQVKDRYGFAQIIGQSKALRELFYLVERVAQTSSTLLIQGESGTGKELFAKAIHYNSPRKDKPFVAVNCGVLNDNLLESELFGHVQGAFTGAVRAKKGLFEEGNGGTVFLDEIGDVTPAMQVKLLRVLQEREVKPVGSNEARKVDIRVIAATHRPLKDMVADGQFREDLYYRIAVITLNIPPLRDRIDDIPRLVAHFIKKFCDRQNLPPRAISPEALSLLMNYAWPGNVRELENVIERAVYIGTTEQIEPADLPAEFQKKSLVPNLPTDGLPATLKEAREQALSIVEEQVIRQALHDCNGNKKLAARRLGISRGSLYNKLDRYHIT